MELVTVELRGPLSRQEFEKLKNFLEEHGSNKRKLNRTMVDFSRDGISTKDVEVKLRVTNGNAELIVKNGDFHDPERSESNVRLQQEEFENALLALSFLGYTTGVVCHRNIIKFNYNQLEFSLIEVPGHSYYYEAEIFCERENSTEAEITIREVLESLHLEVFSKSDFFDYVESLNVEANSLYDHRRDFPLKLN